MKIIKKTFDQAFEAWGITLPEEALSQRQAGKIEAGWYIQYVFGKDEKGEYMDYYAVHRMTNERHRRIYENGDTKALPARLDSFGYDPDVPGDEEKKQAEFYEYNRKVSKELKNKGFE